MRSTLTSNTTNAEGMLNVNIDENHVEPRSLPVQAVTKGVNGIRLGALGKVSEKPLGKLT